MTPTDREPLAQRVARRFLADMGALVQRIEAIPGWDRSNFLRSVHDQARRGRALSPKQIAVIDKIEKDQAERPAALPSPSATPHADFMLSPRKEWVDHSEYLKIIDLLRKKTPVTVYDPRGLIAPNQKAQAFMVKELANDFWGRAEHYAEANADENDGEVRQVNEMVQHDAQEAAKEMEKAQLHVKQNGPVTTLTLQPSYEHIRDRHHGRAWMGRR